MNDISVTLTTGRAITVKQGASLWQFLSEQEAIEVARAILAALGEPVDAKPDRSELDKAEAWRWMVVESESGKKVERWMRNAHIDDMIAVAKKRTTEAFTVYEAVAHVAAEPKLLERKVVRL
jgi:hypothetical protein